MIRNPAPVIQRTHENQTDLCLAILNFLAANGPLNLDVLHARFFEFQGRTIGRGGIYYRLKKQIENGKLKSFGPRYARLYRLSDKLQEKLGPVLPDAAPYIAPEPVKAPPPPPYVGQIVPPRRVDVMFGPVYQPKPVACTRPGAMDFKGIARRGHAC